MPGLIVLVVIVVVGLFILGWHLEKKRIAALAAWCRRQGWTFLEERRKDPGRGSAIPLFDKGHSRYGQCWMTGVWGDYGVRICEYHYAVTTSNGKSTSTQHHWHTVLWMGSPRPLKALAIRREHWGDKLAGLMGFTDIEFESLEFNRAYHVAAADRRWANAALPPESLELLLGVEGLEVHTDPDALVVIGRGRLEPRELPVYLRVAHGLLERIPEFA